MKNVKTLIAAAVLSSLSFASFAAVQVQSTPVDQHKVGTISASAGTTFGFVPPLQTPTLTVVPAS